MWWDTGRPNLSLMALPHKSFCYGKTFSPRNIRAAGFNRGVNRRIYSIIFSPFYTDIHLDLWKDIFKNVWLMVGLTCFQSVLLRKTSAAWKLGKPSSRTIDVQVVIGLPRKMWNSSRNYLQKYEVPTQQGFPCIWGFYGAAVNSWIFVNTLTVLWFSWFCRIPIITEYQLSRSQTQLSRTQF